jgi:NADPH:quinone reductase-like Zn-dependent oxidoreductase
MKAVRLAARGGPEQLHYEDAPDPVPERGYALVEVRASGFTPTELGWSETWERDGRPRLHPIPGHELAGVVREAPPDGPVRQGDAVFGLTEWVRDGTLAQLTTIRAADLAPKPEGLDFVETAALPLSALTAWQAFHRYAHLEAGQTVLIHGAAGGVGVFAVQLARNIGARVIGTASPDHRAALEALGCDEVIDYHETRFETVVHDVDVVLDTFGGETLRRSYDVLRPGGHLVDLKEEPAAAELASRGLAGTYFIVEPSRRDLLAITALVDAGRLRPIVSRVLPLADARAAFEDSLRGHNFGKSVLTVG